MINDKLNEILQTIRLKDLNKAYELLLSLKKQGNSDPTISLLLCIVCLDLGDTSLTADDASQIMCLGEKEQETLEKYMLMLLNKGEKEKALWVAEAILEKDELSFNANLTAAKINFENRDYFKSSCFFRRLISIDENIDRAFNDYAVSVAMSLTENEPALKDLKYLINRSIEKADVLSLDTIRKIILFSSDFFPKEKKQLQSVMLKKIDCPIVTINIGSTT